MARFQVAGPSEESALLGKSEYDIVDDVGASHIQERLRLLILFNILAPYRVELFNWLAGQSAMDLLVLLTAETEAGRHWTKFKNARFCYQVVSGASWTWRRTGQTSHVSPRSVWRAVAWRPNVIVGSCTTLIALTGLVAALIARVPFVWWVDTTLTADAALSRGWLRGVKRLLARSAKACVASSTETVDYLVSLGVDRSIIRTSFITIDTAAYQQAVTSSRLDVPAARVQLGVTGRVVLYVGQLEHHKGVEELLEAFIVMSHRIPHSTLLLVGAGSLEASLRARALEAAVNVAFAGFWQPEELPLAYALGDVFCLLSHYDCFGAVVVEAAAAGLPLLISSRAGAARDFVAEGVNGWVVDPFDKYEVADRLCVLLSDPAKLVQFGSSSLELALSKGLRPAGEAFVSAVELAVAGHESRKTRRTAE